MYDYIHLRLTLIITLPTYRPRFFEFIKESIGPKNKFIIKTQILRNLILHFSNCILYYIYKLCGFLSFVR